MQIRKLSYCLASIIVKNNKEELSIGQNLEMKFHVKINCKNLVAQVTSVSGICQKLRQQGSADQATWQVKGPAESFRAAEAENWYNVGFESLARLPEIICVSKGSS